MQPINGDPRGHLSVDQVRWLIQDAPSIDISFGCELIDQALNLVLDISDEFGGGTVSRNAYATLHGTGQFAVRRDLAWGSAIIRPYMVYTDGEVSARFNLGAYYCSIPERQAGEQPPTYAVTGFDILHRLNDQTGTAYSIAAGTPYVTAIESILLEQGYTRYIISPTAAGKTLPSAYVSPLDDNKTWLGIVNDLLAAIGYAGIWSDWDGRLRCERYMPPRERQIEWTYTADPNSSILAPEHTTTADLFELPNRWVFIRNNNVDGFTPVEGNGIYTYVNETWGPASVEAREGRVVTRVESVEAADQGSLIDRAWRTIDADLNMPWVIRAKTAPNPLHWHFDRLALDDPDAGVIATHSELIGTEWSLPLNGDDMEHSWTVL